MAGPTVLSQRRAQRRRYVARDRVLVAIVRTTKHRAPGRALPPSTTTLEPQEARLTQRLGSDRTPTEATAQPGISTPSLRFYLALYHDADVKAGTGVLDEFDLNGGHFEVAEVVDETVGGGVYGRLAVLRRVSNS